MFMKIFRGAVALQTVALLVQAVTAGLLLSSPDGRALHSATALVLLLTTVAQLVAAILVWRPGRGPARFAVSGAIQLVLVLTQMALGFAHVKSLHVPLGVAMFGFSMLLLGQVTPFGGRRQAAAA
ncbi:hypothetical protein ACWDTT_34415 [Streptosporangium sandarakinum]|uniref:hypothetical protein n=1 Tax=Streptosporangium TaxID=2000 RepID=UPI0031FA1FCE